MRNTQRISRFGQLHRAVCGLVAVAVLMAGLPVHADSSSTAITYGTWQLIVKADTATINAGRNDFEEYVLIEHDGISAHEMCRLGFGPIHPTTSAGPAGSINFTVILNSRHHGSTRWVGNLTSTRMTGTLAWTKDGKVYNYTFTGVPFTPVECES
jgi:hypothetical protein